MKVYVHLAYGFDARLWERRWLSGELIGFNEPSPYGYHHARAATESLRFSVDHRETRLGRLLRGGARLLLGFDIVHAWRNRTAWHDADVVWTHTESQHLALAALFKITAKTKRPKLLAQSVWLIDVWEGRGRVRQAFYRWLIAEADVLTFHSPLNRDKAAALFPGKSCVLVPFGIRTDIKYAPLSRKIDGEARVLALGNDRHRDWATLFAAFGNVPGYAVKVATGGVKPSLVASLANVEIVRPTHNDELLALYRWADVVVLPLHDNLHASGATVLQEAALAGRPVVSTRAGGLEVYFTDDEVAFVPAGDPDALRAAAACIVGDAPAAQRRAGAAQARMKADGLSSRRFIDAHIAISKVLLRRSGEVAAVGGPAAAVAADLRSNQLDRRAPARSAPGRAFEVRAKS